MTMDMPERQGKLQRQSRQREVDTEPPGEAVQQKSIGLGQSARLSLPIGTGGESSVTGSQRAIAILRIWPASSRRHKNGGAQRASAQAFVNAYPPQQSLLTPTCRHSRTPA